MIPSPKYVRIVADENVPKEVVDALRGLGFQMHWVLESKPGLPDPAVWTRAKAKRAILLTLDKGLVHQLSLSDFVDGPDVIEYVTHGFDSNELQHPILMRAIVEWLLRHYPYHGKEHLRVSITGRNRSRRQCWQQTWGRSGRGT